jgi:hypothetical protein
VPASAQWCSLCFADLREPAPVRQQVPAAATLQAQPVAAAAAVATDTLIDAQPGEPGLSTPAATPLPAVARLAARKPGALPSWPCPRCGAAVSMNLDACTECGEGFLAAAATSTAVRIPMVGNVTSLSGGQRLMLGAMVGVVLMVVLVVLFTIGGMVL